MRSCLFYCFFPLVFSVLLKHHCIFDTSCLCAPTSHMGHAAPSFLFPQIMTLSTNIFLQWSHQYVTFSFNTVFLLLTLFIMCSFSYNVRSHHIQTSHFFLCLFSLLLQFSSLSPFFTLICFFSPLFSPD